MLYISGITVKIRTVLMNLPAPKKKGLSKDIIYILRRCPNLNPEQFLELTEVKCIDSPKLYKVIKLQIPLESS